MDTINSEGDLDALRRHASAWAVLLAWARLSLTTPPCSESPCWPRAADQPGSALRNTAPILAYLGILVRHTLSQTGAPRV